MPAHLTEHYQLSLWEADDQVQRADFNSDNQKIDAALKAQADALQAEQAAREAAVLSINRAMVKIETGCYVGDGAESRVIPPSFTPFAVYSATDLGATDREGRSYFGGLALTDHPVGESSAPEYRILEIVNRGFRVHQRTGVNGGVYSNNDKTRYHYIAFG